MNKKGFATVYIVLILGSLMFAILSFIEVSSGYAARLICSDIAKVTGRSIIGEYNLALYNRYGIFAFKADEKNIERKIYDMLETDCRVTKGLIRLDIENIYIDTSPYPSLSPDILGKQISKLSLAGLIKSKIYTDENNETSRKNKHVNRNVSLPDEILPSKLMGFSSREVLLFSGGLSDLSVQSSIEDEYILSVCSSYIDYNDNTYLNNETEYVLFGYKTDKENIDSLKRSLIALRLAIDTAKEPGMPTSPGELAVKIVELTAKAENEADEIMDGNIIDNMDYRDCLRIFLKLLDREEKIARLMDIMQINLQHIDGSGFAFSDYSCGLDLAITFFKDVIAPNTFGISRKIRTEDMTFEYN